jgi:hypothetical protein
MVDSLADTGVCVATADIPDLGRLAIRNYSKIAD